MIFPSLPSKSLETLNLERSWRYCDQKAAHLILCLVIALVLKNTDRLFSLLASLLLPLK